MGFTHFKGFVFIVVAVLSFTASAQAQNVVAERHVEVAMRMMGHQLLLNSGNDTSRVLPITFDGDRYKISFDTEFEFFPEKLKMTIDTIAHQTQIAETYLVEVQYCDSTNSVYSYEHTKTKLDDIGLCAGRMQPQGCYNVLVTIIDSGKPHPVLAGDHPLLSEDSSSVAQHLGPSAVLGFLIPFFFLTGLGVYLIKRRREAKVDPDLIQLGEYLFDKRNMELSLEENKTELTSKEADLLEVLHDSANNTVEREVILQKVWGDEGDYVGRTLDVFISKLRKKLEGDPNLRIANIRGIGYKLVLNQAR